MESKFKFQLSAIAYEILLAHVALKDLSLMTAIINEKIEFHKLESSELLASQSALSSSLELIGYSPKEVAPSALKLGVPGKSKHAMPDTCQDNMYREWIRKLVEPRTHLPKSKLSGSTKTSNRANPLEPSIIFATVTNTYGECNCMHLNGEVTQVVCGFNDSVVRVWRLGEQSDPESSRLGIDSFGLVTRRISEVIPPARNQVKSTENTELHHSSVLELVGHSAPVYGVSQDPSTPRLVLSASADKSVRMWDVGVAQPVGKYAMLSPVWGVAVGPLGYYFAAATHDATVAVYSSDRTQALRIMTGHIADATSVQWHPNASLLLSGSDDRTCRLWDLRTGECVRLLSGCPSAVSSVAVSSAGGLAAAGCENGSSCLWDLGSGRLQYLMGEHTSYVNSLCFDSDDSVLVTGSSDCSVKVWNLQGVNGSETLLIHSHKSFGTKYTSVMHVGLTQLNLIYAGGPFDVTSAPGNLVSVSNSVIELAWFRQILVCSVLDRKRS